MRLLVDIPSIDTDADYTPGQGIRIQRGNYRASVGDWKAKTTWHADVIATDKDSRLLAKQVQSSMPESSSGTIGGLAPIEHRNDRQEWVRRVVIELRSDMSPERMERIRPGKEIQVYDEYSHRVRAEVIMAYDIKKFDGTE